MIVDQPLMTAWLAARSLARGLPPPVDVSGGACVETGAPDERRRYLFASPGEGLRRLAETIDEPFVALKLCRPAEELLSLVPTRWQVSSRSWVMGREGDATRATPFPEGYHLSTEQRGPVSFVAIRSVADELAASGYAAEHGGVFIYDRVRVEEPHRRRGLGAALACALDACRRDPASRQILTATDEGRALYATLGWIVLAPYTTVMIPA